MITLLEPRKPAGFTSGGYRYQERITGGEIQRRAIDATALDEVIAEIRAEDSQALIVVDGLFAAQRAEPLPNGVIALLHMVPDRSDWCREPLHVIATSDVTARAVAEGSRSVAVVRPGIDACFAEARGPHRTGDVVRIVCCGTVCEAKGQPRLVRILGGMESPWHLQLLGNVGDDVAIAASDRIDLVGAVDTADVARRYAASDLFVSLSRSESFGMAAAEAATTGLPILALDTGEIGTFFEDDKSGWLLPLDASDEHIAAKLRALLQDPSLLANARTNNTAPQLADWRTAADRFASHCRKTLSTQ